MQFVAKTKMLPRAHLLALLALGAASALAQSATQPNSTSTSTSGSPSSASPGGDETIALDEFRVNSTRASLASAQEIKQNAGQVVDSIVASDINKLPDIDVSYALSRIPGIQVAHVFAGLGGNGSVTIHGLTQIENTLDGFEVFSPGGTSGGGIGSGQRTFDYSQIPSSLIAGIDVYKTAAANQLDGGLGGLIDVRLRKPLDFGDGLHAGGSVGIANSTLLNSTRPNYNFFVNDSIKTSMGKIGILVAGSYNITPWREDNIGVGNPTPSATVTTGVPTALMATGYNATSSWGAFKTLGYNAMAQRLPSDRLKLYAGVNHNQWNNIEQQVQFLGGFNVANVVPGSGVMFPGSTTAVQSATVANVATSAYSDIRDLKDRSTLITAGASWTTDDLTIKADFNHLVAAYGFYNNGVFGLVTIPSLTYNISGTVPAATIAGVSLTDPGAYKPVQVFNRLSPAQANTNAGKLDADYNFGNDFLQHLLAGVRYSRTEQNNSGLGTYLGSYNVPAAQADFGNFPGAVFGPSPIQNFFDGYRESQPSQYLVANNYQAMRDPNKWLKTFGDTTTTAENDGTINPLSFFKIIETTSAFYLMPKFAGKIGGLPFDGNIGVRVVQTKEDLNGNQTITPASVSPTGVAVIGPINISTKYTDWLPSFNARLKFTDQLYLRVAASKTITRPSFGSMSPSLTLNQNPINPSANTGSQGNPNLKPIRSTNYDASLEYYISKDSIVYAAGFYKEVTGFISSLTQTQTFGGVQYQISTSANLNPATIKGGEIGYNQFFTFLPAPFDGFGFQTNFTLVDSTTPSSIQGFNIPLTNLSRKSYNVIVMYEKGPFSARVAYNWRDKYVTGVSSFVNVGLLQQVVRAYGDLDASVNYSITKNIEISIQGVNLTNALRYQYWGSPQFPSNAYIDGIQLMSSITWKL